MNLGIIIARLTQQPPLGAKIIGGAAALDQAQQSKPAAMPAIFVVAVKETAEPNRRTTGLLQRVTTTFGIVYAVSNVQDAQGQVARDQLDAIRTPTINRILGWLPAADASPCQLVSGSLVAFRDQVLWWQDQFKTDYHIEVTP